MRLIDADKLMPNAKFKGQYDLVSARDIVNQPTVKAISIEWIKDYVGPGVSDDIFQRNRRFVLNMIKDWEKENETNR